MRRVKFAVVAIGSLLGAIGCRAEPGSAGQPGLEPAGKPAQWQAKPAPKEWDIFNTAAQPDGTPAKRSVVEIYLARLAPQIERDGGLKANGELDGRLGNAGLTSLGTLTLLGAGYTSTDGKFSKAVAVGVAAIEKLQKDDGRLADDLLNHTLACLALSENWGMTRESNKGPAQKAVDYLARQQAGDGGFPARAGGKESDATVSILAAMSLKSAMVNKFKLDSGTVRKLAGYFDKRIDEKSGLVLGTDGRPDRALISGTAMALQFLGVAQGDKRVNRLADALLAGPPDPAQPDFLTWYWGQLVCFEIGGERWKAWQERCRPCLLAFAYERTDIPAAGAPGDPYAMAMLAQTINVYYRYLPIYARSSPAPDGAPKKVSDFSLEDFSDEIRRLAAEALAVPVEKLNPATPLMGEDNDADDLDMAEIVMAGEDAFDVTIHDDDMGKSLKPQGKLAVEDLARYVFVQLKRQEEAKTLGVRETRLGTFPGSVVNTILSKDGGRVAFVVRRDAKWSAVLDGKPGAEYDGIMDGNPVFSPDGKRVAYVATKGEKRLVVLDGQEGPEFDGVGAGQPVFSSDGKRLAYAAGRDGKWVVVIDGQLSQPFDGLAAGSPVLSPDGRRAAYMARNGSKWLAVLDGKPGPEYDGALRGSPIFSPDGKRLAYAAKRGNKWLVVLDGKPGPEFDGIAFDDPIFSPDSRRTAYSAKRGDKWVIVLDGQPGPEYDGIAGAVFSPDGKRFAHGALRGDKYVVVVDGQPGPGFDGIVEHSLLFSPDSKHLAYGAFRGDKRVAVLDGQPGPEVDAIAGHFTFGPDGNSLVYGALKGNRWFVVSGGKAGEEFDAIGGPLVYSPDGKRLAYAAMRGDKWVVVLDGQPGPEFGGIVEDTIVFSPDGKRLAYAAKKDDKCVLVLDGQPGLEFAGERPVFSPDGRHLAYVAIRAGAWVVALDGQPGPSYDKVLTGCPIFLPDGTLEFLAFRDMVLYRVAQAVKSGAGK